MAILKDGSYAYFNKDKGMQQESYSSDSPVFHNEEVKFEGINPNELLDEYFESKSGFDNRPTVVSLSKGHLNNNNENQLEIEKFLSMLYEFCSIHKQNIAKGASMEKENFDYSQIYNDFIKEIDEQNKRCNQIFGYFMFPAGISSVSTIVFLTLSFFDDKSALYAFLSLLSTMLFGFFGAVATTNSYPNKAYIVEDFYCLEEFELHLHNIETLVNDNKQDLALYYIENIDNIFTNKREIEIPTNGSFQIGIKK